MKPNNKYGYTESYLKSILKDDWDNFSQWMRGKTMVFDARIKEDVYFTYDVRKYLSRDKDVLDSINMSKENLKDLKNFLYICNKLLDIEKEQRRQKILDYLASYDFLYSKEYWDN